MTLLGLVFFSLVAANENGTEREPSHLGSVSFVVNQRFYSDPKLGNVNGFSEWGAISFDAHFGLYEFPYRIEPYVGLGYIQNSASLCGLDSQNNCIRDANGNIEDSQDKLKYYLVTGTVGVRHRLWDPKFFLVVPYAQLGITCRYGRVRKVTQVEGEQQVNVGGDFGAEIGGGFIVSFFYDDYVKSDMNATWDLKDFGLITSIRYLPAGWFRQGLGNLEDTGGWDFGLGLILDW